MFVSCSVRHQHWTSLERIRAESGKAVSIRSTETPGCGREGLERQVIVSSVFGICTCLSLEHEASTKPLDFVDSRFKIFLS